MSLFQLLTFSSKIAITSLLLFGFTLKAQPQKNLSPKLDPPHWYVGLPDDTLQVLIHYPNIGVNHTEITGNQSSVKLLEVNKLPNPNYINLTIIVEAETSPHAFTIHSKGKAGKFKLNYSLLERNNKKRGLDQNDLIYLITPDRFANGDSMNDELTQMHENTVDRSEPYMRHGGDIQGMIDHLDYIQELGMTAVWPNPLYENNQDFQSYHGYAFTDFYRIDPRFGTNELYKTFVDLLHQREMKIIMDVVYNHIGDKHYLYTDIPDSNWFHFWPSYTKTNYRATALMDPYASSHDKTLLSDGWFDRHMPDLNQQDPALARYLIQQTIWWIEAFDIDALRIDTYAYPDQEFMRNWATELKKAFPDIFLFAETWVHGPTVQGYFMGDALGKAPNHLDGLTDFQVYYAINDALTKKQSWTDGISRLYYTMAADYIYNRPENMVTFVDNHDVARFYGHVGQDFKKFEIGMGLLYTLRGIPSVYYGTEILMAETDGHGKIREDFPGGWASDSTNKFTKTGRTEEENKAFELLKNLAELRRSHPALTQGSFIQFVPLDDTYVFARVHENDTIIIAINLSDKTVKINTDRFIEIAKTGDRFKTSKGETLLFDDQLELEGTSIQILIKQ